MQLDDREAALALAGLEALLLHTMAGTWPRPGGEGPSYVFQEGPVRPRPTEKELEALAAKLRAGRLSVRRAAQA
jgi:hypothetical protein